MLKGYKTYLVATAAGIVYVLQLLGVITTEVAQHLFEALGVLGLAALRSAIK